MLASLQEGGGAVATIVLNSPDLARWRAIATCRADRRPDLYRQTPPVPPPDTHR